MTDAKLSRVFLHATSESALKDLEFSDLKKFAAPPENASHTVRRGVQNPSQPIVPENGGDKVHGGQN